jgi:hypothetical protein
MAEDAGEALIENLRAAFWPNLLPIARAWTERLKQPAPWPDRFEEWLERCHEAGQTRLTAVFLRYGPGEWNALQRDSTAISSSRCRSSSASTARLWTTPAGSS